MQGPSRQVRPRPTTQSSRIQYPIRAHRPPSHPTLAATSPSLLPPCVVSPPGLPPPFHLSPVLCHLPPASSLHGPLHAAHCTLLAVHCPLPTVRPLPRPVCTAPWTGLPCIDCSVGTLARWADDCLSFSLLPTAQQQQSSLASLCQPHHTHSTLFVLAPALKLLPNPLPTHRSPRAHPCSCCPHRALEQRHSSHRSCHRPRSSGGLDRQLAHLLSTTCGRRCPLPAPSITDDDLAA